MESNNHHPLESITHNKSLSMLESLIPFVDYPLKLPLALFIKFSEIKMIINAFHSTSNLVRLGLHNSSANSTDILSVLTGIPPEMLQMLFSLNELSGDSLNPDILSGLSGKNSIDFGTIANMFNKSPFPPTSSPQQENTSERHQFSEQQPHFDDPSTSFDSNIDDFDFQLQNILSEYDMMEAAQYDKEQYENFNESSDASYYNNKGDI